MKAIIVEKELFVRSALPASTAEAMELPRRAQIVLEGSTPLGRGEIWCRRAQTVLQANILIIMALLWRVSVWIAQQAPITALREWCTPLHAERARWVSGAQQWVRTQ